MVLELIRNSYIDTIREVCIGPSNKSKLNELLGLLNSLYSCGEPNVLLTTLESCFGIITVEEAKLGIMIRSGDNFYRKIDFYPETCEILQKLKSFVILYTTKELTFKQKVNFIGEMYSGLLSIALSNDVFNELIKKYENLDLWK